MVKARMVSKRKIDEELSEDEESEKFSNDIAEMQKYKNAEDAKIKKPKVGLAKFRFWE